jgi:tetratricopeptide (TPR) repeat protein
MKAADLIPNAISAESMRLERTARAADMLIFHGCEAKAANLVRECLAKCPGLTLENILRVNPLAACLARCHDSDAALEAIDLASKALAALGSSSDHRAASARLAMHRATILLDRRQPSVANVAISQAIAAAEASGDTGLQVESLELQARSFRQSQRWGEAIASFEKAIGILGRDEDAPAARIAALHRQVALAAHGLGDRLEAEKHERLALDGFERAEDWKRGANAAIEFAEFHIDRNRWGEGIASCRRGLALAIRSGEPEQIAAGYESLGDALQQAGRFREALAEYRQAARHIERNPLPLTFRAAFVRYEQGRCLCSLGRHRDAIRYLSVALRDFRMLGSWEEAAHVALYLSDAETELDHANEARELRRQALALATRAGSPRLIAEAKAKAKDKE